MKKILTFLLLFIVKVLYAQPGDREFINSRIKEINRITDSLIKNPVNYPLIWARTELIFKPFFSMYTMPSFTSATDTSYNINSAFYQYSAFNYKEIDILNELNKLINNSDSLNIPSFGTGIIYASQTVNKANYYYKRGQYFYLKNNKEKAIADYLTAFNANPDKETKQNICIAIAAYYFNESNLEKALLYIDMIAPQYDKGIVDFPLKNKIDYQSLFEQEKLQLFELTKQSKRLENFHINKTYSLFNLYNKLIEQTNIDKTENNEAIKEILSFAIKSLSKSEKYLFSKKIDFKVIIE